MYFPPQVKIPAHLTRLVAGQVWVPLAYMMPELDKRIKEYEKTSNQEESDKSEGLTEGSSDDITL